LEFVLGFQSLAIAHAGECTTLLATCQTYHLSMSKSCHSTV